MFFAPSAAQSGFQRPDCFSVFEGVLVTDPVSPLLVQAGAEPYAWMGDDGRHCHVLDFARQLGRGEEWRGHGERDSAHRLIVTQYYSSKQVEQSGS